MMNVMLKKSIAAVLSVCRNMQSRNPVQILQNMLDQPSVHMHGPEHHILAGAAVITAYYNAGGNINFEKALDAMANRGKQVPGGTCGFWGCCGAAVSCGISYSLITDTTPMSKESWGTASLLTSAILGKIGKYGGPRCCKRTTFIAVIETAEFLNKVSDIKMEVPEKHLCSFNEHNEECLKESCPFF